MARTIRETLLAALAQHKGDDAERMRRACRNMSAHDLQQPWGASGKTASQVLREYSEHESEVQLAATWVQSQCR